jgi:ADP-ribosylglycohydrolase
VHDVPDPRDLVRDEAEQPASSRHPVGSPASDAARAAADADIAELTRLRGQPARFERSPGRPCDEPEDDATLLAGLDGLPRPKVPRARLPDRITGAWPGRCVGNTLGKPVEGLPRGEMEMYLRAAGHWPQTGYLPLVDPLPESVSALHPSAPFASAGRFSDVPRDDDIGWTILGLHLLERHGRGVTTEQIAAEWLDRVPFLQTYTAERAAYRDLVHGLRPPETAVRDDPYHEWIGGLIRGDVFGYVSSGDLGEAARLIDSRLSHTANGRYGEMWAAALTAAALCADTVDEALRRACRVVPPGSRLAEALRDVLSLRDGGAGATEALDRDSSGATVGSVFGAVHGGSGVPADLVGSTHVHVRSAVRDFDRVRIEELAARTLRLAQT